MDEATFWLQIWRAVIAAVVVLILTIGGCTAYESKRIADAVEKGTHPIDARCGIAGMENDRGTCSIRASK